MNNFLRCPLSRSQLKTIYHLKSKSIAGTIPHLLPVIVDVVGSWMNMQFGKTHFNTRLDSVSYIFTPYRFTYNEIN